MNPTLKAKRAKQREIQSELKSVLSTASYNRSVEDTQRGNDVLKRIIGGNDRIEGPEAPKRLYFILRSQASCMVL